jgi:hypothetical protein
MACRSLSTPTAIIFLTQPVLADSNMTVADQVYEQAKLLPAPLAQEALDFVLFLRSRQERGEWRDLVNAQSVALTAMWENPEYYAWNDV